jgi:hypothetical protein
MDNNIDNSPALAWVHADLERFQEFIESNGLAYMYLTYLRDAFAAYTSKGQYLRPSNASKHDLSR